MPLLRTGLFLARIINTNHINVTFKFKFQCIGKENHTLIYQLFALSSTWPVKKLKTNYEASKSRNSHETRNQCVGPENVRNTTSHKSTETYQMNVFSTSCSTTSISSFWWNRKWPYIGEVLVYTLSLYCKEQCDWHLEALQEGSISGFPHWSLLLKE